jgi:hypothetical protein
MGKCVGEAKGERRADRGCADLSLTPRRRQSYMSACYFLNPAETYTSIVLVDCAVNRQVGPPSVVI